MKKGTTQAKSLRDANQAIEALKQKAINDPWGYKAKRRKYHKFYDDGECIGCTIRELEEGKEK